MQVDDWKRRLKASAIKSMVSAAILFNRNSKPVPVEHLFMSRLSLLVLGTHLQRVRESTLDATQTLLRDVFEVLHAGLINGDGIVILTDRGYTTHVRRIALCVPLGYCCGGSDVAAVFRWQSGS